MSDLITTLQDTGPALVAVAGVIAGLITIGRNVKRLRGLFTSPDQAQIVLELRELADTRLAVISELRRQLDEKTEALVFTQRSLDDCQRQRQEMYERFLRLVDHTEDKT